MVIEKTVALATVPMQLVVTATTNNICSGGNRRHNHPVEVTVVEKAVILTTVPVQ